MCTEPGLTVISLGWGVQSFGLAAKSALGELPRVDYAVHADTGWERSETYAFAEKWIPWLEAHGIEVVTVRSNRAGFIVNESDGIFAPVFTTHEDGSPSGMMRRQCTHDWKIVPMRRWLSAELKRLNLGKSPGIVEQWIGFTLDEVQRVTPDDVQYITKAHPYLEMLDRPYTRQMVIRWLHENDLEVPVKSACIFCPFHGYHQWREIQ